jgi:hypothetical protein
MFDSDKKRHYRKNQKFMKKEEEDDLIRFTVAIPKTVNAKVEDTAKTEMRTKNQQIAWILGKFADGELVLKSNGAELAA